MLFSCMLKYNLVYHVDTSPRYDGFLWCIDSLRRRRMVTTLVGSYW